MNKVLIITYYWPPSGGAGVQRWLRFSKYLPQFGWEPVILTVDPGYGTYPAIDSSLENEVPPSIVVHRTKATDWFRMYSREKSKIPSSGFAKNNENTFREKLSRFIRGNFFIPDPRRGWNKFAFKKACEIIETSSIENVITTSPPHSTQLIGLKIKKKYSGINWIADLRDPWTDIYYYSKFYPSPISSYIDRRYERLVLKSADKIITVGKSLKDIFSSKISGIEEKFKVITNGYDEEDFTGIIPSQPDIYTISYIGTLSEAYPIDGLLNALQSFKKKGNIFKVRFVGTVSSGQKELIISSLGNHAVEFVPYVDHAGAIRYMSESTVLLLIIPDHRSNKTIITGKLFEYIAAGKPVICIGPIDGDAAEILKFTGTGDTFNYNDISSIENYLLQSIKHQPYPVQDKKLKYSRKELTKQISEILNL